MAKRMTEKHICSKCNGTGCIAEHGDDCAQCKRKGYIENGAGGESVCPTCNGEGYTMTNKTCRECSGQGFKECVYEITDYVQICLPCGGTGWVNDEHVYHDYYGVHVNKRRVECSLCHGSGSIADQRIKRVR